MDFSGGSLGVCQASVLTFEVSNRETWGSAGLPRSCCWVEGEAAGGWWDMWGANSVCVWGGGTEALKMQLGDIFESSEDRAAQI